jgi:hypothetical protein
MRRACLIAVLAAVLGGCGPGGTRGFDSTPNQTVKLGKVTATLRRFAILHRTGDNLDKEPTGVVTNPPKAGKGYYVACEFGILVDGRPVWDLAPGVVTSVGPVEVIQPKKTLAVSPPVQADKIPAQVKTDASKRDTFYVQGTCTEPTLGDKPQPFEVRLSVTLKSGGKVTLRFPNLTPEEIK